MAGEVERWEQFRAAVKPVTRAPVMHRVNGIGQALVGAQREVPGTDMRIKGAWLTFLFLPLVPTGFYIVRGDRSGYRFYGKLSVASFFRLYGWRALTYYLGVWAESLLFLALFVGAFALVATLRGAIH